MPRHEAYLAEARRLRDAYAGQITLLIGFEGEWIRPEYEDIVLALAADPVVDYFVGSLHHVAGVPIDFDRALYARATAAAGGSEEVLWARYYDEQFEMLTALRPLVVGHFDLVRLLSARPGQDVRTWAGGEVWRRIVRNLGFVRGYGGWLECNSSALRKGLAEPYPARSIAQVSSPALRRESGRWAISEAVHSFPSWLVGWLTARVVQEWVKMGGKFTMSDDSHGIAQVGTNYHRALDYLEGLGVQELWTLERRPNSGMTNGATPTVTEKSVSLVDFRKSLKLALVLN